MKQSDLIQQIISAEHQAQAISADAMARRDNLEAGIEAEISALRAEYEAKADAYLLELRRSEDESKAAQLKALDEKYEARLALVENTYAENKDAWVDAIFSRIVERQAVE